MLQEVKGEKGNQLVQCVATDLALVEVAALPLPLPRHNIAVAVARRTADVIVPSMVFEEELGGFSANHSNFQENRHVEICQDSENLL